MRTGRMRPPREDALGYRRPCLTATDTGALTAFTAGSSAHSRHRALMPMSDSPLLVADDGAVRTLAIHRPERLNALDSATIQALQAAFEAATADSGVRVVVLTGSGPKAFVAGADIAEMSALSAVEARDFSLRGQRMMRFVEKMPKPVLAMVNGFALGGGLELAMSCHLRIAADTAKLGQPEINLGLIPGFGGSQRLLRLAGRAATLELCLTGVPIPADRALQLGIVNRVVPAAELQAETSKLAAQLAAAAPLALRGLLDCVNVGGECGIEEGLEYESAQFGLVFSSEDMREGTSAFLEKRKPTFAGK